MNKGRCICMKMNIFLNIDMQLEVSAIINNCVSVDISICIYVCVYLYQPNKMYCDAKYLYFKWPVVLYLYKHKYI